MFTTNYFEKFPVPVLIGAGLPVTVVFLPRVLIIKKSGVLEHFR
jgi:hypothetical protein